MTKNKPFISIGEGSLKEILEMGACIYHHGVPFVQSPQNTLSIIDSSLGVKNVVIYFCKVTDYMYNNWMECFMTHLNDSWMCP